MKNRLQVGGLALITHAIKESNVGKVVKLVSFIGSSKSKNWGTRDDFWLIECDDFEISYFNPNNPIPMHPAQHLMPLGDDKGIELYGLREEIMTGHDKEAV